MKMKLGKLLTVTVLTTGVSLSGLINPAEAGRRRGTWSGSSNGIFLELQRNYEILNATSKFNSTPTNIRGTKFFSGDNLPSLDTLFFPTSFELDFDVSPRTELGNLADLTSDLAQEVTYLQSQGAIYGQDYFLFDNAVTDFSAEFNLNSNAENRSFATPINRYPSDFDSDFFGIRENYFTTGGKQIVDTEDVNSKIRSIANVNSPTNIADFFGTSINLETATILVSKLKLDDELIIGQQDDLIEPGAFYRTDQLSVCGFSFSSGLTDSCSQSELTEINNLGFNKNNGISFPVVNSLNGQFNPEYITETEDKLLFKYRVLIDLGGDAARYFLFIPAFTAPDIDGNFNELNSSSSLSLFDFFSFPDNKSGGCANPFGNSPDNAICLGAVLDLGESNNIENKITKTIDLLDDLTTANIDNPNLILSDTKVSKYRRTQLVRDAENRNNQGVFNLRPYGVFSPPVELVITEEEVVSVPEPNSIVTWLSFAFLGMGMIYKQKIED